MLDPVMQVSETILLWGDVMNLFYSMYLVTYVVYLVLNAINDYYKL